LKRFVTILFLLLYINIAFGVGIDCHFCNGELVSTTLYGFGEDSCKCTCGEMSLNCCKTVTAFYKTDSHQSESITLPINPSFYEYNIIYTPVLKLQQPTAVFIKQIEYYNFIRTSSSRDILTFIHILRI